MQVGAWQVRTVPLPMAQTPSTQSLPTLQSLPSAHGGHIPPPQSTSVSLPSLIPSVQLGATQVFAVLHPGKLGLVQSESVLQPTHLPATAGTVGSPQTAPPLTEQVPLTGTCTGAEGLALEQVP